MGMYTELRFDAWLRSDTPDDVIEILRYMTGVVETEPVVKPNHPLFGDTRWEGMLRSTSAYFDWNCEYLFVKNEETGEYHLDTLSNFKNYDDEIEHFLDWIRAYVVERGDGHVGYRRYEEADAPTELFIRNSEVIEVYTPPKRDDSWW